MDIKGMVRTVLPLVSNGIKEAKEARVRVKTDDATDRDANGQQNQSNSEHERKRESLTPEEIDEAKKVLEALPGMKDSSLTVRVMRNAEGIPSLLIVDALGKTVRRIPESEITSITLNRQQKSGHLLNKAL